MLLNYFYYLPTWAIGVAIAALSIAITTGGLLVVHKHWSADLRRLHNDIAGFVIAVVGVIYAVLVASIAVMAWETYDQADNSVSKEAALIGDIYRDAPGLGATASGIIRHDLHDYTVTVTSMEWHTMSRGELPTSGWKQLEHIQSVLAAYKPENATQQAYLSETISRLNDLYDARHERLLLATRGIHPVIWFGVCLGGLITVVFTFFFGLPSLGVHLVMSNGLALSIALVITIIAAMDHPFLGDVDISAQPFHIELDHMQVI